MGVNHTTDIRAGVVNGAVDDRASFIQAIFQITKIGAGEDIAVMINFKQTRSGNLFVHHAVGIDQKSTFFARDAG